MIKQTFISSQKTFLLSTVCAVVMAMPFSANAGRKLIPDLPSVEVHYEALRALRASAYSAPRSGSISSRDTMQWKKGPVGKPVATSQPAPVKRKAVVQAAPTSRVVMKKTTAPAVKQLAPRLVPKPAVKIATPVTPIALPPKAAPVVAPKKIMRKPQPVITPPVSRLPENPMIGSVHDPLAVPHKPISVGSGVSTYKSQINTAELPMLDPLPLPAVEAPKKPKIEKKPALVKKAVKVKPVEKKITPKPAPKIKKKIELPVAPLLPTLDPTPKLTQKVTIINPLEGKLPKVKAPEVKAAPQLQMELPPLDPTALPDLPNVEAPKMPALPSFEAKNTDPLSLPPLVDTKLPPLDATMMPDLEPSGLPTLSAPNDFNTLPSLPNGTPELSLPNTPNSIESQLDPSIPSPPAIVALDRELDKATSGLPGLPDITGMPDLTGEANAPTSIPELSVGADIGLPKIPNMPDPLVGAPVPLPPIKEVTEPLEQVATPMKNTSPKDEGGLLDSMKTKVMGLWGDDVPTVPAPKPAPAPIASLEGDADLPALPPLDASKKLPKLSLPAVDPLDALIDEEAKANEAAKNTALPPLQELELNDVALPAATAAVIAAVPSVVDKVATKLPSLSDLPELPPVNAPKIDTKLPSLEPLKGSNNKALNLVKKHVSEAPGLPALPGHDALPELPPLAEASGLPELPALDGPKPLPPLKEIALPKVEPVNEAFVSTAMKKAEGEMEVAALPTLPVIDPSKKKLVVEESKPAKTAANKAMSVEFSATETSVPFSAQDSLQSFSKRLTSEGDKYVTIVAYAGGNDDQASISRRVSLARALSIRAFLIDLGVESHRIEVQAKGNKVPGGNPERADILLN